MNQPFGFTFLQSFIELFVAVDVLGILPIYAALASDTPIEKRRVLVRSCLGAALILGVIFIFLGRWVLRLIGITLGDFQVAGGLILVLIGILDLVGEEKKLRKPLESIGVVPLGIPLIVGPAVISVLILLADRYGWTVSFVAFVANLLLVGLAFQYAPYVSRFFGKNGMQAISKVMMLLLIGIGVRMIRLGIAVNFPAPPHP